MNFSAESQNYIDHMRNLIQQRSQGLLSQNGHGLSSSDTYSPTASLAKLIRAGPFANGGGMTSVIQAPQSHHHYSQEKSPHGHLHGKSYEDMLADRRHSIPDSIGSAGSGSNISPVSSAGHEHDELADSPPAKVPNEIAHPLSPVAEEPDDEIPPGTPRSEVSDEYHGSVSSEADYDARNRSGSFNSLLHQQLLHRKGSILQYCLTAPNGPVGLQGGSDAEADHTSTSPGSSDLQDDAASGGHYSCQVCDFTSTSKFHFNSHMNTHCVHRCPIPECNYSTRTEGRLRRHVKNHHNSSEDPLGNDSMEELKDLSSMSDGLSGTPGAGGSASNKQKHYKCKQCHDYVASSKNDYYDHQRLHIKPEKLLVCPLEGCRFVTEYKHHLEYHVRNHSGSKPFKCPNSNCNYQCVNKSMLNSHMKSHSNFYQFRCECGYATKYCHSLKQHLKKYQHKATNNGPESAQLSMAASPQPLQIIQAPSPKLDEKPAKRRRNNNNRNNAAAANGNGVMGGFPGYPMAGGNSGSSLADGHPGPMAAGFPYGLYPGVGGHLSQFQQAASIYNNLLLSAAAANGLMHPAMAANGYGRPGMGSPDSGMKRESPSPSETDRQPEVAPGTNLQEMLGRRHNGVLRMLPQSRVIRPNEIASNGAPLDLSGGKENGTDRHSESPKSDASSGNQAEMSSSRRRRKGPAFKLDLAVRQRLQDILPEEDETEQVNGFADRETIVQPQSPPEAFNGVKQESKQNGSGKRANMSTSSPIAEINRVKRSRNREFICDFCGMAFEDTTMYTMHMGFHGRDDPYTCGLCGHAAADKVSFFLHIAKAPHF